MTVVPKTMGRNSPVNPIDLDVAYTLFGVPQLSEKFFIHNLGTLILDTIKEDRPITLEGWDKREMLLYRRWEATSYRPIDSYAPRNRTRDLHSTVGP